MSLSDLLTNARHQDESIRRPAELRLQQLEKDNFAVYLVALCQELGDEKKPAQSRQLAGLNLKNCLVAKAEAQRVVLAQRWMTIDKGEETRQKIRAMLLMILASPHKPIRSTAALCIAKIASIEIPNKLWGDLVPTVVKNIGSQNPHLREASFETLGYLCEELPDYLKDKSGHILNAISSGMRPEESNAIKLVATQALANSLDFAKDNMQKAEHRELIMNMIFSAFQSSTDDQVRYAAFQCFVEVATSYYSVLGGYIERILKLTLMILQKETGDVALQAIEFWSSICDEEIDIIHEIADAQENGRQPKRKNFEFMAKALKELIPILLNVCLTKQSEQLDDDTWNIAMAAGTCLGLIAQATGDACVGHVLPFVRNYLTSSEWRYREAATLAFGCILEGPNKEKLEPLVGTIFPFLLKLMQDKSPLVRDTAAWTIGRICHLLPDSVTDGILPPLMHTLVAGLKESPKIAANVCWAIHNLASAAVVNEETKTSPISKYFEGLMRNLLVVTERRDVYEANLISSAYEAINELIHSAAPDQYGLIATLIPNLMNRLRATLQAHGITAQEREKQIEVQALLCGSLQIVVSKVAKQDALKYADMLMTLYLQVLKHRNATVHEEALMAIGGIANLTEKEFIRYMPAFMGFLLVGLKNHQEHHVCSVAVGVVGDVARALEEKLVPHCDEIMHALLQALNSGTLDRGVKPQIISCLGDIALAIGGAYDRYLMVTTVMLSQAANKKFDLNDGDNADYVETLRESILEAYTGILQGLSGDKKAGLFMKNAEDVLNLLDTVAKDENRTDGVTRAAVGLIGDMASRLAGPIAQHLRRPSISVIVNAALQSQYENTKEAGNWTRKALQGAS